MKVKKPLVSIMLILSGIILGALLLSAVFALTGFSLFGRNHNSSTSGDEAGNAALITLAYTVLEHIRDEDYQALSQVVHPEAGVVFTPYATVNLSTDRRLGADQIAVLNTDTNIYIWGVYNGSGEPIELTQAEYFKQFIPAENCLKASIIGVDQIVRSGNALENITDELPDVKFVDFHMPASPGTSMEDYDWSSLKLGFEEFEGRLWLIAVVTSKWTA